MRIILLVFLLCTYRLHGFQSSERRVAESAYVKDFEVYIKYSGSSDVRQLTNDGTRKELPALSKDRSRVAFLVDPGDRALGLITIIAVDGDFRHDILFRPTASNVSGMRFIDTLEWISDQLLVVSGSVNPSTGEYVVIDANTGKEIRGYLVDGFAWAASPDGLHAAYIGYIPHFTPEDKRHPQICIDDECGLNKPSRGFPPFSRRVRFTSEPLWSPDSTAVAVTAEDADTGKETVIVRPVRGTPVEQSAPQTDGTMHLSWDRGALLVRRGDTTWKLQPGASRFVPLPK